MAFLKFLLILATLSVAVQGCIEPSTNAPTCQPAQPTTCPTGEKTTPPPTCPPIAPSPTTVKPPTCPPADITTSTTIAKTTTTITDTTSPTTTETTTPTTTETTTPTTTETTTPTTTETTTPTTTETTTPTTTETTTPTTTETTTSTQTDSPITPVPPFECPKEFGAYPHEFSCILYYRCRFGKPTLMQCVKNKYFNKEESKCTKDLSSCEVSWRNVGCTKIGLFPVPDSCTDYYACKKELNGDFSRNKWSCLKNQYFNPELEKCVSGNCPGEIDQEQK